MIAALIGATSFYYLTTDSAFRNMPIPVLKASSSVGITNPCRAAFIRAAHELDKLIASDIDPSTVESDEYDGIAELADMCEIKPPGVAELLEGASD